MSDCERFCELVLEVGADGAVTLTEPDNTGNGYEATIRLHPLQARRIGELAGLTSETTARRELLRLQRRLSLINHRAEQLAHWLGSYSDHEHADLTAEVGMAGALADLVRECVEDFAHEPEPETVEPVPQPVPRDNAGTPTGQQTADLFSTTEAHA